jgi:hypothetical protein
MSYRPQNGMATAPVVQDDRVTLPLDDTPAREQVLMSGDGTVSPGGDTQELYYMHDFTDTAIDRSIIEYRERQGPDYKDTNRGATNRVTFAELVYADHFQPQLESYTSLNSMLIWTGAQDIQLIHGQAAKQP